MTEQIFCDTMEIRTDVLLFEKGLCDMTREEFAKLSDDDKKAVIKCLMIRLGLVKSEVDSDSQTALSCLPVSVGST